MTGSDTDREVSSPDIGGMTLTPDAHLSPACVLSVDDEQLAPSAIQSKLFRGDALVDALIDAACDVAEECPPDRGVATYLVDAGVTALDGAYARLVANAVAALEAGSSCHVWRLVAVTRQLGGQTELNLRSTLDDIERGPIALLALAGSTPTVELRLESTVFDAKSTRRRRFIAHLSRLTPGVDVRVVGSRLVLRQLLDYHPDDLPASVSRNAQQRLRSAPSTLTEQRAQTATAALEDLGADHPAWDALALIDTSRRERLLYSDLYEVFDDVTESAVRRRLKRLRDADLLESVSVGGDTCARLTPSGRAALEEHPDPPSSADWSTDKRKQTESHDGGPTDRAVINPRNQPTSTVLHQRAHDRGEGDPHHGQQSAPAPPSAPPSTSTSASASASDSLSAEFLDLATHHAASAAASTGYIAHVERPLDVSQDRDRRVPRYSYDSDRDEVVVQVDYSDCMALTATRLCAALLSDPAMEQVLTADRLAGSADGSTLDGLDLSSLPVLRGAVCLGWLSDEDADGTSYRRRLEEARRKLLAMTSDIHDDDGQIDEDTAHKILCCAHGLMGVALRVYDLLGVDVVRELRFVDGAPSGGYAEDLQEFLATATSISSRYGAYSGYRVLHEGRTEKRDDLLSTPSVDLADPAGTLLGPWVLSGPGVSDLPPHLSQLSNSLDLQEDKQKFAKFCLTGAVVDGNRRRAVAEAVNRLLSFKGNLCPDRQAISVLAALSGDVFAAADAVAALGGEEDESRALDMQDIRYGLSQVSWRRILPEVGGTVVSKVMAVLVDAQEELSTAELADLAGCSTRSLSPSSTNARVFAELEAAGVLKRTDQGAGAATLWRLQIPFRVERHDGEPVPEMLVGQAPSWHVTNAAFEVFATAADEFGVEYEFEFGGDLAMAAFAGPPPIDREVEPLVSAHPRLKPMFVLLATLLDQVERLWPCDRTLKLGARPDARQVTLEAATG